MRAVTTFLRYWGPVIAWMAVIFTGSGDAGSGERTSRIIGPVLLWLFPRLSFEALEFWIVFIRKGAHVVEYAILAMLIWRALCRPVRGIIQPWVASRAWGAFSVAFAYALSDEFHQMFVPNREGAWRDVGVDAFGAALGLLALWLWRRRRAPPPQTAAVVCDRL